jgi:hypothetical protein
MDINDLLKDPSKIREILWKAIIRRDIELADTLMPIVKDPELAYEYAYYITKGKVKDEFESIIAQSARYSYDYAKDILKRPFPKGEDVISQNSNYAYLYARDVIKGRWPKGEDAIATDFWSSVRYAVDVLKDRFKKGEDTIINTSKKEYFNYYIDFLRKIGKLDEFLKDHPEVVKL